MTHKNKRIILAYLAKPKYGGWATYTCHLYKGLQSAGYEPILVKQGNRTEKMLRDYGRKMRYQNVSSTDLLNLCKQHPTLIVAVDKHHHDTAHKLIDAGAAITIHDPTELKEPISNIVVNAPTIVIRESMLTHLPHATYIQHPYQTRAMKPNTERKPAVALSRIDFDKHTDIIINANTQLETPIDIYGFMNTVYAHFNLNDIAPNWKDNYYGTFTADDLWAAARIATNYQRVVDMSIIKKDGGGTQYTFLEAANANTHLILHNEWQPTGLLKEYAHTCSNHTELTELCTTELPDRTQQAQALLQHHDATAVAHLYATALNW
jgi:hypothetical protein